MNGERDYREKENLPQGSERRDEPSRVLPVVEEQLRVDTKVVETGKVHISKTVSENDISVTVPLQHEVYDIERVPVNQIVDAPPPAFFHEGDTMVIPVVREVLVKRYEVVEEVRVTKRRMERDETVQTTLLREDVTVERRNIDQAPPNPL
ncbi:YsnF/AvaK domain-containing protein [Paraflavisolibacter sp. H34]|uniref:YsnF/AvaK domain-containing protein n=1 Tax=Huijunlia imazamoxiresistens TaxID=3127457 RepID=UPI0030177904